MPDALSLSLFSAVFVFVHVCVCLLATTNTTNTVYLSRVEAKDEKETGKQKRRNQSVIHATATAEARSHSLILFFLLLHHFLPTKGSKAENWCKHTEPHTESLLPLCGCSSLFFLLFYFMLTSLPPTDLKMMATALPFHRFHALTNFKFTPFDSFQVLNFN